MFLLSNRIKRPEVESFSCEKRSPAGIWMLLSCIDLLVSLLWETAITWFHKHGFNEGRRCIPWSYNS